jgi:hypothetical protein
MGERAPFWQDWGDPRRIARGYQHTHIGQFPGLYEIMENTLGSLYICSRGLFQRRRWKLGVMVRNFFSMVIFPEFLGSPMYRYITKSCSLCRRDVYVKASGQNSTVLYTLHHAEFSHGNIFLSSDKFYRACQWEVTGASLWLYRKDSLLKCSWLSPGATGL